MALLLVRYTITNQRLMDYEKAPFFIIYLGKMEKTNKDIDQYELVSVLVVL